MKAVVPRFDPVVFRSKSRAVFGDVTRGLLAVVCVLSPAVMKQAAVALYVPTPCRCHYAALPPSHL